jgi:hypothetical protein
MSHPAAGVRRRAVPRTAIHRRAEFQLRSRDYVFSAASTRSGVNGMW